MAARTVPVMPSFFAGQKLTGTLLNQVGAYGTFWADKPMFRMYQSIAQSIATGGSGAQVTMDTSDYDTESGRSNVTPYSYTIPVGMTGRWRFNWMVAMGTSATGARSAFLTRNGTRVSDPTAEGAADNDSTNVSIATTIFVNAGDVIGVWAWQNSGGSINTNVTPERSYFEGELVSLANP